MSIMWDIESVLSESDRREVEALANRRATPKPWPPAELKGYGCGLDADDPAAELAGWLRARRYQPEPTQITVPLKYFDTLKKAQSKLTTWRIVAPFVVCGTLCIGALIGRAL